MKKNILHCFATICIFGLIGCNDENLTQNPNFKAPKRIPNQLPGSKNLKESVSQGNFSYWLTDEDMTKIGNHILKATFHKANWLYQIHYPMDAAFTVSEEANLHGNALEDVLVNLTSINNVNTLSIAVNLGKSHWVSLVAHRTDQNSNWIVFYADSFGTSVNKEVENAVTKILNIKKDQIHSLSFRQQTDGYNCGVYTLINIDTINDGIRKRLTPHQIIAELEKNKSINCEQLRKDWANQIDWDQK